MLLNGRRVMEHRDKDSMLILLAIEDLTQR